MIDKLFKIVVILAATCFLLQNCAVLVTGGIAGYQMAQEKHAAQQKVR